MSCKKQAFQFMRKLLFPLNMTAYAWTRDIDSILLWKNAVIVELKCVETLLPIHKAQLLTYLRLANKPLGLLLNFNVVHLREGIKRVLNNRYEIGIAASQS
jgi:GxxExxY protein